MWTIFFINYTFNGGGKVFEIRASASEIQTPLQLVIIHIIWDTSI